MTSRKRIKWIILILVLILLIAAIFLYIFVGKDNRKSLQTNADLSSLTVSDDVAENFKYTESEIREKIINLAKKRFGEDAFVIPLNTDGPSQAEIGGKIRYIYIYAADSLSKQEDVDNIKGLYHVDPITGEIFDNGNGKMEKIHWEDDSNEE